ncbi:uncharacterized protein LOC131661995 isoform X1 [Vicia villosa]|uniref:uncharacterized protein LOC131661995 isoform X1 n=2 Tax=Vicia villosa TaxID=3911 RepID=UPI00273B2DB1|nr:uncharacterized protein LOC131661995 isoform X1 [Vicia villosa]
MTAGRNVDINVEAMMRWTGAIGQAPQENVGYGGKDEFRAFGDFQRCNPPIFEGGYGPDKAHAWMREIEKIFQVVSCTDVQKVQFGTHMLTKEADVWWSNTVRRFEIEGIEVTWTLFRDAFLGNYFPEDVHGKKEVGFLQLKRGGEQFREKSYDDMREQFGLGKKLSGGGASTPIKCYRCGETGHKTVHCGVGSSRICYSCGEQGHNCAMCDKPKKEQAKGKVSALSGAETNTKDKLI